MQPALGLYLLPSKHHHVYAVSICAMRCIRPWPPAHSFFVIPLCPRTHAHESHHTRCTQSAGTTSWHQKALDIFLQINSNNIRAESIGQSSTKYLLLLTARSTLPNINFYLSPQLIHCPLQDAIKLIRWLYYLSVWTISSFIEPTPK